MTIYTAPLTTAMPNNYVISLDIGGSHVTAATIDLQTGNRVGQLIRQDLPHTACAEVILANWVQVALAAEVGSRNIGSRNISHVGFAVPGPFDLVAGISRMKHKFSALHDLPLRPLLAAQFVGTSLEHIPLLFGNDADMFALGEWWAGAGKGCQRMIGVTLGTGLGTGFVDEGRLINSGPEVPPDGELWNVPFRDGYAEMYASGAALSRLAEAQLGMVVSARALAQRSDVVSQQIFEQYGQQLAEVLAPWVGHFGAERLVIGGNVGRAFARFGPALQSGLPASCVALPSQHFEQAALYGAALLY